MTERRFYSFLKRAERWRLRSLPAQPLGFGAQVFMRACISITGNDFSGIIYQHHRIGHALPVGLVKKSYFFLAEGIKLKALLVIYGAIFERQHNLPVRKQAFLAPRQGVYAVLKTKLHGRLAGIAVGLETHDFTNVLISHYAKFKVKKECFIRF